MTLGFTTQDLANLKAALASGALRVQIGDREVIYRSLDDIIKIIKMAEAELSAPPTTITAGIVKASFSKGSKC